MNSSSERKLFQTPWRYAESFLVITIAIVFSFIIEYSLQGAYFGLPPKPYFLIFFVVLFLSIIIAHFFIKSPIISWFSSIPATISSISIYTVIIILLGIIPQDPEKPNIFLFKLGLTHITESLPFLVSTFIILIILLFTILKRITILNRKNIIFLLNHFGLFLVIMAGAFGSADKQKLSLKMNEGDNFNVAFNDKFEHTILPFSVELKDFSVGEYTPEMVIVNENDDFEKDKNGRLLFQVKDSTTFHIGQYVVDVKQFLADAVPDSEKFRVYPGPGSCPAANIEVHDSKTKALITKGWISSGSFIFGNKTLPLKKGQVIGLLKPQPKKFMSKVRIHTDKTHFTETTIEVNKPFKIDGWYIYQVGYDEQMGKWSQFSIFEFVYDPWLKVIYAGVIMLMAGAVLLIFTDKK